MIHHEPVLLNESMDYLITNLRGNYFDGTIGFGGHSSEILKRLENNAKLVGTDKDENAINFCKDIFKNDERIKLYRTAFTEIDTIAKIEFIENFDGIFADLGVSSFQLDQTDSGFTYREDAPLDLRMDKTKGIPASKILNKFSQDEIADILFNYGEERKSRIIAKRIVEKRNEHPIATTKELVAIVEKIIPQPNTVKSLSRIFQALRIYVNNELEELKIFLEKSFSLLKPGGRLVVLSYHSLEDRIVKEFFKYENLSCTCPIESPICVCNKEQRLKILTRKPVTPADEEIEKNRRSRSAKLRAAEKL